MNKRRSPFKASEMSARSTLINKNLPSQAFKDVDYDDIMKSSSSAAVRNKYRESLGPARQSEPKTANASLRTSIATNNSMNYWDQAQVSSSSFYGKNMSVSSENFKPAENMKWDVNECAANDSNWADGTMRPPEMSFGKYAKQFVGANTARDLYSKRSPVKKPRGPLIELSSNESSVGSIRLENANLEKLISKFYDCHLVSPQSL